MLHVLKAAVLRAQLEGTAQVLMSTLDVATIEQRRRVMSSFSQLVWMRRQRVTYRCLIDPGRRSSP